MLREFLFLLLLGVLVGCAAPGEKPGTAVQRVEMEVSSPKDKGEPIYSTSVAIRMAELLLRERGLSCESRSVMVSFCEGVYTVTFEKPPDEPMNCDYRVEIDANTSKVLKVVTTR